MSVPNARTSPIEVSADPDTTWRRLYRVGGLSGILIVVPYLAAIVLISVAPPPLEASGEQTLEYIAAHKWLYGLEQVLWVAPGVLAMIVFLALAVALRRLDSGYAAIAGLVGITAWALTLALPTSGGGAPVLVYLSNEYTAATTAERRIALATVAEGLIAENNTPSFVGVLTTVGILLISLLMVRGVFSRWIAYLGIATGAIGILSEALRPLIGAGYTVYGVLLLVWFPCAGWSLQRLGRARVRGGAMPEVDELEMRGTIAPIDPR
jgi:Domain of unknown function (DUF4386)